MAKAKQKSKTKAEANPKSDLKKSPNKLLLGDSFRLARKRDLPEKYQLISTFKLTSIVFGLLKENWRMFGLLLVLYIVVVGILIGTFSIEGYRAISDFLSQATAGAGASIGMVVSSFTLFAAGITGRLGGNMAAEQQLLLWLVNLIIWMSILWLVRQRLAGVDVRLRDGLYNGPVAIVPSLIIVLVMALQSLPGSIGGLVILLVFGSSIISGGIEAALFSLAGVLLIVLSLYWLLGSVLALVAVTIPGKYPLNALRSSGQLIRGNRLAIAWRLVWLLVVLLSVWLVLLLPVIVLDQLLGISWLPIVPIMLQILSAFSLILISVYLYLMYKSLLDGAPD